MGCFYLPSEQVLLCKHAFTICRAARATATRTVSPRSGSGAHRFHRVTATEFLQRRELPGGPRDVPAAPHRTPRSSAQAAKAARAPLARTHCGPARDSARPFRSRAASAPRLQLTLRAAQLRRAIPAIHHTHTITHRGAELSPFRGYPLRAEPWPAASAARLRGPPGAPAPRAPPPHLLAAEAPHRPIPPRSPRR